MSPGRDEHIPTHKELRTKQCSVFVIINIQRFNKRFMTDSEYHNPAKLNRRTDLHNRCYGEN